MSTQSHNSTTPPDLPDGGQKKESRMDMSDKKLKQLLLIMVAGVVAVALAFGVVYYIGQRPASSPTSSERAVAAAEEMVRTQPNNINARMSLADAYAQAGRQDEALGQYNEIIQAEPSNRIALLGAGQILYQKGDRVGALKNYDLVIKNSGGQEFSGADPQLQEAYYFKGIISLEQNNFKDAITNLEAALKIDKTDADAWYTLGDAQMRAGNFDKAAAAYMEALAFVPTGWCDPYKGLEGAYKKLNDKDGMLYASAMGSLCNGQTTTGITQLEALTKGPLALQATLGLGLAAETSNKLDDATKWYNEALKLDKENVTALTALARIGQNTGVDPNTAHSSVQPSSDPTGGNAS